MAKRSEHQRTSIARSYKNPSDANELAKPSFKHYLPSVYGASIQGLSYPDPFKSILPRDVVICETQSRNLP